MINLTSEVLTKPDYDNYVLCLAAGEDFDLFDYCECFNVDPFGITEVDEKRVIKQAQLLVEGLYLGVRHD